MTDTNIIDLLTMRNKEALRRVNSDGLLDLGEDLEALTTLEMLVSEVVALIRDNPTSESNALSELTGNSTLH